MGLSARRLACLVLVTACVSAPTTRGPWSLPAEPRAARQRAAQLLEEAGERYPVLEDYALYFRARAATRAGRGERALAATQRLVDLHPDSIWVGPARLLAGRLLRHQGDATVARRWLAPAMTSLPEGSVRWACASLALAETEYELGAAAAALDLAQELRRRRPRGLAARRARRLSERIRRAHPELGEEGAAEEAEMRLREGDAAGARDAAESALARNPPPPERAHALWVRAHAEHALGRDAAAEATCLTLAREGADPLAPRALVAAAGWHWNTDDDAAALRLFREVITRFPESPQAAEALYAMGRIAQEAGRYGDAFLAYNRLAERFPRAALAGEARWRAGWVRYLAGEFSAAERWFGGLAARSAAPARVAAEYWQARTLERLGRGGEARARLAHVAERHPLSYYAGLAEERLGRAAPDGALPEADPVPPFPADLASAHAERARLLADLGFTRFARLELDALAATGPRRRLLDAYRAVGAVGAALRLARELRREPSRVLHHDLYPLGYWDLVRPAARARGVDPLLVLALIRQESFFEPEAVSPADARGLMQLLPATARQLASAAGEAPPDDLGLYDAATNIRLGVALLARLLGRYGGSPARALAAYNAGEDAVAKWERRYAARDSDEFVELISFRETRDYVKTVLRNYRLYRRLYASSASASSPGSPPKAPFDMMTMTSPGRADSTR